MTAKLSITSIENSWSNKLKVHELQTRTAISTVNDLPINNNIGIYRLNELIKAIGYVILLNIWMNIG